METLTFDAAGFGTSESRVEWSGVRSIGIRTSSEGPFVEDVFWMFLLDDALIELPGSAIDGQRVRAMSESLPGFDNVGVTRAMGSTAARVFRVWHPDAPKLLWNEEERLARFTALVVRLQGLPLHAAATFKALTTAWNGPKRRYHDCLHLAECLHLLDRLRAHAVDADVVELALWFHDSIYDSEAKDNEERSAQWLLHEAALLGIPPARVERAVALVRWTENHVSKGPVATGDAALLMDIDLAILGSDPLRFLEYEAAIEEEYSQVHPIIFHVLRGRFIASLLARKFLFHTDVVRDLFEKCARSQLLALLASPRYWAYRVARFCLRWPVLSASAYLSS